jgi:hypothetical protein
MHLAKGAKEAAICPERYVPQALWVYLSPAQ